MVRNKTFLGALALGALAFSGLANAATFSGTATGAWTNPDGTFGYAINNADAGGTADVTWGTPISGSTDNLWSFDGAGSDGGAGWTAGVGSVFSVGDFSYRNGSVTSTNFAGADLSVTLAITSPLSVTELFSFEFDVINTPNNTGDPVLDGDIASIVSGASSQTFTYLGDKYTLNLLGFSSDGGSTIVSGFNVPENATAGASLYGKITLAPIPLPAGAPLLLTGVAGFAWLRRRKAKKA
ncbi:choice-of-anchor K domain-containing protein [Lutimaribacter saemankumensis]|uniref:VPLPA-CTERM protein sorting domain-containing protein n=1 Tax=Lutimaribacter saemankumensis TaxID=490829 RepID=A0A1G8SZR2_9RHOB|nr:choice-of-anchor K domain-containing protein [Lutimaribacter saemankumensis]SDJ34717.1 VPLPA-CTERM protein sorting domain-containing protein [Lutimaribacter saemankumensis]